jgi:hypothetical protein
MRFTQANDDNATATMASSGDILLGRAARGVRSADRGYKTLSLDHPEGLTSQEKEEKEVL